ncbi:MAG: hypothetical protein IJZ52_01735 [Clostridium sp.]|nr:hypothetical protein [Clostridium sp.]
MSDRDTKKPNNPDDLADVKSLIGNADAGDFELDDILAEYGVAPNDGHGAIPVTSPEQTQKSNVVAFPGVVLDELPAPEPEVESAEEPDLLPEYDLPDDPMPPRRPAEVIPFPGEAREEDAEQADGDDGMLTALIKDINRRADDYADRMYEEDERIDPEEVRRLERLIPGTDKEEEPEPPSKPKKVKKTAPPPPDTPPQELARTYLKGLKSTRLRLVFLFLLCLLAVVQLAVPALGYVFVAPLGDPLVQSWFAAGVMAAGTLLGIDILLGGIINACKGRVGMDTLAALGCVFTLADAVVLAISESERLPYTAAALTGLFFLLLGTYHKKCAQRLSCRTAAASSSPYRVTLDEGKWNGRDTYSKWAGDAAGFGSQIQVEDGADRIYHHFCPVVLLLCIAYSLYITITRTEAALWCASAVFTAAAAFGAALSYGRSFHLCARRLAHSGAALAGWPGIVGSRRADRVLITDTDLFPPGYVELNGFKVLGDFPMERVVAYTATMIRDSGSGLAKLFHDYLRTLGGLMRNSERLCCYEGGGLSATIRGDQVLVGSAAFMNLMDITLPAGLNVKSAVFCAINGELAGIFALNYFLPDTVFPALDSLIRENVGPVLATRDFNLIPAMLQQRFKLSADRMDFPPVERRRELSAPDQPHGDTLAAILCREGLYPFAEAVVCAKRLRRATRVGAVLCCVSSLLGLLLTGYLVFVSAYGSLSPLNLLLYLLMWLLPVWLLTAWTHRF